jgi:UDP-3-O-[3-hydroxymyristoyl] glucosamine N-acyltransferase
LNAPAFTLSEIVARLGGEAVGEASAPLTGLASLDSAGASELTFLANPRYRGRLAATRAGAVILAPADRDATDIPRIVTGNPYAYYARAAALYHPAPKPVAGIHPFAQVDAGADVAASAQIDAFAVVGAAARVGDGVRIGAGCVVGEGVALGAGTWLHPRVTIYPDCTLGERCIVHAGAVIGSDGFGMALDAGRWVKIPQVGGVRIGNDVEIGANTTIDRGAMDDTVIGDDVKLDNQIQIAHNCVIGAHTVIAGCTGIAGSVTVGEYCMIGGGAGLVGHITVCDHVVISGMTLVTKSITKPGTYTSGQPMMPHAEWLERAARERRLYRAARTPRATPGGEHERDDDD